nr:transposase [Streptomyces rubrogriseus]
MLPVPAWLQGRGGRPEGYCHRVMLDAVRYVVDNGVKWANLPADFPPYRRVHAFARRWQATGLLAQLHDRLRDKVRQREDRSLDPTAAIVDSQSVRAAANIPRSTSGWGGGKKVGGRKRHLVVDCLGLVLAVVVTAASVQDRDAGGGAAGATTRDVLLHPPGLGGRRLCGPTGGLGDRKVPAHPSDRQTL